MLKIKTKVRICLVAILSIATGVQAGLATYSQVSAEQGDVSFAVNVVESLSVTITQPADDQWASGDMNTFLRNKISLTVTTNNTDGFIASMYSSGTSDLVNTAISTATIPTLASSSVRSSFPYNRWGYSFDDNDTNGVGVDTATYSAMTTSTDSPIVINNFVDNTADIYFGTKANAACAAGTYTNDVVISVVTGTVNTPDNPIVPGDDDTPNDNTPTYVPGKDASVSTSTSTSGNTSSTNTTIFSGEYTKPLGVTETTSYTSNVSTGTSVATGLLVASATAATSGLFFFILAKRRKDDDDEEM